MVSAYGNFDCISLHSSAEHAFSFINIFPLNRHQTKAGSNASRYDLEKWAKRPFPGEEIYVVGEAYSIIDAWNEGALRSAYYALKEGWGIEQPES